MLGHGAAECPIQFPTVAGSDPARLVAVLLAARDLTPEAASRQPGKLSAVMRDAVSLGVKEAGEAFRLAKAEWAGARGTEMVWTEGKLRPVEGEGDVVAAHDVAEALRSLADRGAAGGEPPGKRRAVVAEGNAERPAGPGGQVASSEAEQAMQPAQLQREQAVWVADTTVARSLGKCFGLRAALAELASGVHPRESVQVQVTRRGKLSNVSLGVCRYDVSKAASARLALDLVRVLEDGQWVGRAEAKAKTLADVGIVGLFGEDVCEAIRFAAGRLRHLLQDNAPEAGGLAALAEDAFLEWWDCRALGRPSPMAAVWEARLQQWSIQVAVAREAARLQQRGGGGAGRGSGGGAGGDRGQLGGVWMCRAWLRGECRGQGSKGCSGDHKCMCGKGHKMGPEGCPVDDRAARVVIRLRGTDAPAAVKDEKKEKST